MDEKEKTAGKHREGERLKKGDHKKIWLVILCAAFAAILGFGAMCIAAKTSKTIYPGVTVLGQDLGSMSETQAQQALRDIAAQQGAQAGITFAAEEDSIFESYASLGMELSAEETAKAAFSYGRSNGTMRAGWQYLCGLLGKNAEAIPVWNVNKETLRAASEQIAQALSVEAIETAVQPLEDGLHLTKPRNGRSVNAEEVLQAINNPENNGTELSGTITLAYQTEEMPTLDLTAIQAQYAAPAVNAGYDSATKSITPGQIHVDFDVSDAQSRLDSAQPGESIVVGNATLPAVTAEMLEGVLFRDVLSSYTTKVGGAEGRHKNVQNTARKINGVVLNTGESLKYSKLVMPFTAANGYYPAPGYLQGKTVDMIGGGACQASSTLYAASLYANLEIVQRRNHGYASDYIGLGLDATVAEGGPEFEVRNNTNYPIKVEAQFYNSNKKDYITVKIYGTKVDDTYVKIRTETLSTTPFEEEIVETDELAPGVRQVEQTAYTGYDVKTYRQIYSGSGTLLSETLEARSKYNARNRIVKVGKAAAQTVTETPIETPVETPVEAPVEVPTEPVVETPITNPDPAPIEEVTEIPAEIIF